jgi:hypothetical protein
MLNYNKTYFLQFLTKTDNEINMQLSLGNIKIVAAQSLKFLELIIYFILFPYIPFRYIPWKRKTSHSIYIIRQIAHGITSIAKVDKYLSTTLITFLN